MGYILLLLIGGVMLVALAVMLLAKPTTQPKGRTGEPLGPENPAADEPTPDRSVTSSRRQIETARHHTPPA